MIRLSTAAMQKCERVLGMSPDGSSTAHAISSRPPSASLAFSISGWGAASIAASFPEVSSLAEVTSFSSLAEAPSVPGEGPADVESLGTSFVEVGASFVEVGPSLVELGAEFVEAARSTSSASMPPNTTRKLAGSERQTTAHARCTHASMSGRYRTSIIIFAPSPSLHDTRKVGRWKSARRFEDCRIRGACEVAWREVGEAPDESSGPAVRATAI
mmetsp:Transcript_42174/g.99430  ORF Transcript_42174/g.99430 Transcript_42174/m.99430 type:complete len:215 (-) Transcript_42174:38-682(-)